MNVIEKDVVTATSIVMRVDIKEYSQNLLSGMLHSNHLEKPYEFKSLVRLIAKMEELFDNKRFPEAFLSPRLFEMDEKLMNHEGESNRNEHT